MKKLVNIYNKVVEKLVDHYWAFIDFLKKEETQGFIFAITVAFILGAILF